jgi:hypothetical protein
MHSSPSSSGSEHSLERRISGRFVAALSDVPRPGQTRDALQESLREFVAAQLQLRQPPERVLAEVEHLLDRVPLPADQTRDQQKNELVRDLVQWCVREYYIDA